MGIKDSPMAVALINQCDLQVRMITNTRASSVRIANPTKSKGIRNTFG